MQNIPYNEMLFNNNNKYLMRMTIQLPNNNFGKAFHNGIEFGIVCGNGFGINGTISNTWWNMTTNQYTFVILLGLCQDLRNVCQLLTRIIAFTVQPKIDGILVLRV